MTYHGSRFAFGHDAVDDAPCPAQATGRTNKRDAPAYYVAEVYDDILRRRMALDEGVVSDTEAKKAWIDAIHHVESQTHVCEATLERIEDAREVARELGWLD